MTPPSSEDLASRRTIRRIWIALPFVFLFWGGLHTPILVLDFWWHLKLGEIIVSTRSIPTTDLFSFTATGRPFLAQNWLAEIFLYLGFRRLGLEGLIVVGALVALGALFFVHKISSSAVRSVRAVATADLLVVVGLMLCSNLRAQLLSFLFFAITYWALEDFRLGRLRRLVILPGVMLLWVNMHGGFVLGLALFAIYVVAEAISDGCSGRLRVTAPLLARATILLGLTALVTLANPSEWRVYEYVTDVARDRSSQQYVQEWQAPRIEEPKMLVAIFVPAILVLMAMIISRRRPAPIELLLVFLFLGFALLSRRNAIWFSLIAGPILARQLEQIDWGRLGTRVRGSGEPSLLARRVLNVAIVVVLVIVSVIASPWIYPRLGNDRIGTSILENRTPVGAVDFMEANATFGRLFHSQIYGDYLIWRLWPRQKTFIDGRVHLFPLEITDGYIEAIDAIDWEEWFQRWRIEYVLLSKDKSEDGSLIREIREATDWRLIFEDTRSVLFSRVSPEARKRP